MGGSWEKDGSPWLAAFALTRVGELLLMIEEVPSWFLSTEGTFLGGFSGVVERAVHANVPLRRQSRELAIQSLQNIALPIDFRLTR